MRTLAIDYGTARVGVAISDAAGRLALPLAILQRDFEGVYLQRLVEIIAERGVERIVVGLPLTLQGEAGPAATSVNEFITALQTAVDTEIVSWDERLTSAQVEKAMAQAGLSTRDRRGRVDAAAATLILQSYLDAHEQANQQ